MKFNRRQEKTKLFQKIIYLINSGNSVVLVKSDLQEQYKYLRGLENNKAASIQHEITKLTIQ